MGSVVESLLIVTMMTQVESTTMNRAESKDTNSISHKEFLESFGKSQFPNKFVNFFLYK